MAWDDVIQLASRFTDSPNGVKYNGLDLLNSGSLFMLIDQYKVTLLDPQTDQFKSSPELKEVAQKIRRIYEIIGNKPSKDAPIDLNGFVKYSTTAMLLGYNAYPILHGAVNDQDIDLVTFPGVDASSNMGAGSRADSLLINSESKEKESAFESIKYLISDEMQKKNVENAIGTVIDNPPYLENIGINIPQLQQKNLKALYEMDAPELNKPSKYE